MLEWMAKRMRAHENQGPVRLWLASLLFRYFPGQLTCGEFEAFLCDYAEGALTAQQREVFERHMRMCPMCEVSLRSYLRVVEMGKKVCESEDRAIPDDVPEDLVRAIVAARSAHTAR